MQLTCNNIQSTLKYIISTHFYKGRYFTNTTGWLSWHRVQEKYGHDTFGVVSVERKLILSFHKEILYGLWFFPPSTITSGTHFKGTNREKFFCYVIGSLSDFKLLTIPAYEVEYRPGSRKGSYLNDSSLPVPTTIQTQSNFQSSLKYFFKTLFHWDRAIEWTVLPWQQWHIWSPVRLAILRLHRYL